MRRSLFASPPGALASAPLAIASAAHMTPSTCSVGAHHQGSAAPPLIKVGRCDPMPG